MINKHGHAINLYKISKAIKPDDATTDNIIAYCYERLGNISKAREIYKDVLKRDHDNIPAKIGLGFIYLREGNRSKAEEYFKEVLKNKKDPWALYGMARIYIMENNVPSALSYFTEALSVSKDKELNSIMKKEMQKLGQATFYGSTN
ncbi:MAG: tetratricopeptide repeat protein [Candidatus Aenigmatarchaeota archaeon]